jgi:hypothetical protein
MAHWHQQAEPMPIDEAMALLQHIMQHGVMDELAGAAGM